MKREKQNKFIALYEPVHTRFEHFCRARVYGAMGYEDLMNDTLLIAFQKIDTLKSDKAFLSFLFSISIRILSNQHKKKKEDSINNITNDNLQDVNAVTEQRAEIYFLYQALDQLPEVQKEAIILFEISGFSIKEIMVLQDSSESAIKQRLKRGREKLAEILSYESNIVKEEVSDGK